MDFEVIEQLTNSDLEELYSETVFLGWCLCSNNGYISSRTPSWCTIGNGNISSSECSYLCAKFGASVYESNTSTGVGNCTCSNSSYQCVVGGSVICYNSTR